MYEVHEVQNGRCVLPIGYEMDIIVGMECYMLGTKWHRYEMVKVRNDLLPLFLLSLLIFYFAQH